MDLTWIKFLCSCLLLSSFGNCTTYRLSDKVKNAKKVVVSTTIPPTSTDEGAITAKNAIMEACPEHEVWNDCTGGRGCDLHCGDFRGKCSGKTKCPGCFCKVGYYRHPKTNLCVTLSDCPAFECPTNEVFSLCGKACHEDCNSSLHDCRDEICREGCFCSDGCKRINGVCTPYSNCPCNENEHYDYGNKCLESCDDTIACVGLPKYLGCTCIENHKRIDGRCVSENNCQCGENEIHAPLNDCFDTCGTEPYFCVGEPRTSRCSCAGGFKKVNGTCCPYDECICPRNEISAVANACYDECGTKPEDCAQEFAYPICSCKPNYARINGVCVPDCECPCGPNEEYKTSSECIEKCEKSEESCMNEYQWKRCTCKEGFRRINETCVQDTECGCPENEHMDNLNDCFESCGMCPEDCVKLPLVRKCYCNSGFVRVDGVCVKDSVCTCSEHETYAYTNHCFDECGNDIEVCHALATYKQCGCKKGYKRIDGICSPDTYCPCPVNSTYTFGNECFETCGTNPTECLKMDLCKSCFCNPGFVRINGKCVPSSECKCGRNEHYVYGSGCEETCRNSADCSDAAVYQHCICEPGFVRIKDKCVPQKTCKCGENEIYTYGNACFESCGTIETECVDQPRYSDCFCKKGYLRTNGKCVPLSECPCPKHERFITANECYEECSTKHTDCDLLFSFTRCTCKPGFVRMNGTCIPDTICPCGQNEEYKTSSKCIEQCEKNEETCRNEYQWKRCTCKEGFKRLDGVCVPDTECPCPANSTYRFGNECYETCGANPIECQKMNLCKSCFCDHGYVRINNECVSCSECQCGPNEYYAYGNDCEEGCNNSTYCTNTTPYQHCVCISGYVRINNKCVPQEKCECEENEVYSLMNPCFESCGTFENACIKQERYTDCFCKREYRRINGKCLPLSDCPCPSNERYIISNERHEECGAKPSDCDLLYNYARCTCEPGLVRQNGTCIPDSNCPCGPNEEYKISCECSEQCGHSEVFCMNEYQWKRCTCKEGFRRINGTCVQDTECGCPENEHMDNLNDCFESCGMYPEDCVKLPLVRKCFCNAGFIRKNGVCVKDSVCTCSEHETYAYTNHCFDECGKDIEECHALATYKQCGCKRGYKRIDGVCAPDSYCPCPVNSTYMFGNECFETCGTNPTECLKYDFCKSCFCNPGFVRINGKCVPSSECKCGRNEYYAYGSNCGETCGNSADCSDAAVYQHCICEPGFVRIKDKCVPQKTCKCGENEEHKFMNSCFETCGVAITECFDQPKSTGCFCLDGYSRINGKCVSSSNCPCPKNERSIISNECYETCGTNIADCQKLYSFTRCTCKPGLVRLNGVCVSESNCPCPKNSSYRNGKDCYETCGTNPATCISEPTTKRCFCNEGHVKINEECISESRCPCGANEEYTLGNKCIEDCSKTLEDCRYKPSYKRCTCLANHKRINGRCVRDTECPCGRNEVYRYGSNCWDDCDRSVSSCFSSECTKGCYCAEGYARINNVCREVSSSTECQVFRPQSETRCGGNEEYRCDLRCLEDCLILGTGEDCPNDKCVYGCFCIGKFKRFKGICIEVDLCESNLEISIGKKSILKLGKLGILGL